MPVQGKFKFCFLELTGNFFFSNVFDPRLVESMDAEPADMEGQPYLKKGKKHYFTSILWFSGHISCTCFVKCVHTYFIFFGAIANGIVFCFHMLVPSIKNWFYMFSFYSATLLNSLMSSSLFIYLLGFST